MAWLMEFSPAGVGILRDLRAWLSPRWSKVSARAARFTWLLVLKALMKLESVGKNGVV